MSEKIKIPLPKLGESIHSATVVRWFKKVGDPVALDEPLLEVSTDKVNSEIPSPVSGVVEEILVPAGKEVDVGETLAIVAAGPSAPTSIGQEDRLTPAVRRILQEKGIPLHEISQIPHSGQGGRLTKQDIDDFCASKGTESCEKIKMSAMRKSIAENMVRSFYEAPHASLITEIDVTGIVQLIQQEKERFLAAAGAKLSITSFAAHAIARSVAAYPLINSSLDKDTIVMKRFVNLGIAVSVDQGIVVPVVRNCQLLPLSDIAREIARLAENARKNKLAPDDVLDGTITMTNFGMTGTQIGIPIIRFPEVAIIGLGAISKRVRVMQDDTTAIRSVMMVSLTFDHRVLDGLYGCGFLNEVKKRLENFTEFSAPGNARP